MSASPPDIAQRVRELIYESCLALNAQQWDDYLQLCDPAGFRYTIVNYSPEIRKEQCWMDRDYQGLKQLFDLLPRHNSDHSQLTRHATVYKVDYDEEKKEASAVTLFTIYRTQLDGASSHFESGQTSLYAVGSYLDRVRINGGQPKLISRTVRLDTRQLDIGSHYPF